ASSHMAESSQPRNRLTPAQVVGLTRRCRPIIRNFDRAPLLVVTPPGHATRTTQARWAAAPPAPRLLLLPSGPDRVHGTRSRRTRPSTQSHETTLPNSAPLKGEFDPAVADCGYRAPLTPRLARSRSFYPPLARSLTRSGFGFARRPEAQQRPGPQPTDERPKRHRQSQVQTEGQDQVAEVRGLALLERTQTVERRLAAREIGQDEG